MLLRVAGRTAKLGLLTMVMVATFFAEKTRLRWLFLKLLHPRRPVVPHTSPALVRELFERMGPTFIKLGQVIASSPGLFPERYATEFGKCLDQVPPFSLDTLKTTISEELGRQPEDVFVSFEEQPLGSASVAQVHGATLEQPAEGTDAAAGTDVVIKVQRPGIERVVDADLWLMRHGARVLEKLFLGARLANLSAVIDDFDRTIHEELDFRAEATNLREFNAIMRQHGVEGVRAPVPVDALTTRRVLVMERFRGFKADDIAAARELGIDPEHYLRKGLRAWLMTVMLHGFFHGDAHAGNLMLLPEGPTIGFIDFGIIGRFDDRQRHQVMRYILAFAAQDYGELADILVEIGAVEATRVDRDELIADMKRVYGPLLTMKLTEIKYVEIMPDLVRVGYKHGVTLPREFILILKQLLYFDRYAKLAAPDLNVFSDYYLVDFLFTPDAMKAGLDFNLLMPLLKKVQERFPQGKPSQKAST